MTNRIRTFVQAALWLLPVWAAMLFLGTMTSQPDPQTAFADFAAYVTTDQFLWSHLINSILGAALGSIGIVALFLYLQDTKAVGKAVTGMAALVISNTLNSSVFGAAAFAQTAAGHMFLAGEENALDFYNLVYSAPLFGTAILALLLFVIGGVFTGIAIAASGRFPRWTGWMVAITMIGFVLSFLFLSVGMSISSALLFLTTVVIAWKASRESRMESEKVFTSS